MGVLTETLPNVYAERLNKREKDYSDPFDLDVTYQYR